jgi:hypothetical protein
MFRNITQYESHKKSLQMISHFLAQQCDRFCKDEIGPVNILNRQKDEKSGINEEHVRLHRMRYQTPNVLSSYDNVNRMVK